jgi:hypothetical protein
MSDHLSKVDGQNRKAQSNCTKKIKHSRALLFLFPLLFGSGWLSRMMICLSDTKDEISAARAVATTSGKVAG